MNTHLLINSLGVISRCSPNTRTFKGGKSKVESSPKAFLIPHASNVKQQRTGRCGDKYKMCGSKIKTNANSIDLIII
jgi:hypothetical protein